MSRMRRTSLLWVLAVLAVGLVAGRLLPPLIVRFGSTVPRVSWTAPLLLFVAAATVGVLAHRTWRSLHRDKQRMTSEHGLMMLSVAKSGITVGALVGGVYGGFALAYVDALDTTLGQERAVRAGVAALACLLLLVASLLLERACVVPTDDDDDAPRAAGAEPA